MEQKVKCEDRIVLVSENIDDHLVDNTKGGKEGAPVKKKDASAEGFSNNNQQKVYRVFHLTKKPRLNLKFGLPCSYLEIVLNIIFLYKARAERSNDGTNLKQNEATTIIDTTKRSSGVTFPNTNSGPNTRLPQYTLKHDGDYLFVIHIGGSSFQADVELEMQGNYMGFLIYRNLNTTMQYEPTLYSFDLFRAIWVFEHS